MGGDLLDARFRYHIGNINLGYEPLLHSLTVEKGPDFLFEFSIFTDVRIYRLEWLALKALTGVSIEKVNE